MSDRLYDQDVLAWSERQAALLRRLAAGEHINVSIDWDNVIGASLAVGSRWVPTGCRTDRLAFYAPKD